MEGSIYIFDKGVNIYKDDFWLNFYAASHYFTELQDFERSLELYEKLLNHPENSIPYLSSIVAKLKVKKGLKESAYSILETAFLRTPEESYMYRRYQSSLYSLRAEIDLNCLNKIKVNCNQHDLNEQPDLKYQGIWHAQKKWKVFQLNTKLKKGSK